MRKDGLSYYFAKHVSLAISLLTIEDIRTYFDEDVGENNNIPVGKNLPTLVGSETSNCGYTPRK